MSMMAVVSASHQQTSGVVERGHKRIIDAWLRTANGGLVKGVENLSVEAWAERMITLISTGKTSFHLNCGWESALPLKWTFQAGEFCQWKKSIRKIRY